MGEGINVVLLIGLVILWAVVVSLIAYIHGLVVLVNDLGQRINELVGGDGGDDDPEDNAISEPVVIDLRARKRAANG